MGGMAESQAHTCVSMNLPRKIRKGGHTGIDFDPDQQPKYIFHAL